MKPLTIEELKALQVGDWVWMPNKNTYAKFLFQFGCELAYRIGISNTYFKISEYGTKWVAYKNKEQAEAKTESVVEEYINDLEAKKEYYKQESHYWFGQANQNYEDCHNGWTEQITKKVAKEILHDLQVRVGQAAMVQQEGTDEELHFLPTKAITNFIECTKSHYEVDVDE